MKQPEPLENNPERPPALAEARLLARIEMMTDQDIRLLCGEMSRQELRTAHALLDWVASEMRAGSAKWVVRDLTHAEPSVSCNTKAQAEAWVRHLWEWRPNARPVIEQEISPNDQAQRPERE